MGFFDWIGYAAAFLTTVSFIPQVVKTYKDGHTQGISLSMYSAFSLGIFAWLIYGIGLSQWPIIGANGVTLVLALMVLIKKIKNVKGGER